MSTGKGGGFQPEIKALGGGRAVLTALISGGSSTLQWRFNGKAWKLEARSAKGTVFDIAAGELGGPGTKPLLLHRFPLDGRHPPSQDPGRLHPRPAASARRTPALLLIGARGRRQGSAHGRGGQWAQPKAKRPDGS